MAVLIANANALTIPLVDQSVHCIVTSPPYWGLRDYGVDGQLGNERTPEEFISNMVTVFRECWRVLRDDGTLRLNLGDSYITTQSISGLKKKDLVGIPWRVALALQADGWYLRMDNIWHKPNPMTESVTDRPTKAHEYVFLLTKSPRYFYDAEAVKEQVAPSQIGRARDDVIGGSSWHERNQHSKGGSYKAYSFARETKEADRPGQAASNHRADREDVLYVGSRNKRSVWTIATAPYSGAHFATYPPDLVEPCVKAGTSARGVCPECGAPWEREVECKSETTTDKRDARGYTEKRGGGGSLVRQSIDYAGGHGNNYKHTETIGWRPTCDCGHEETVPAIVFDPFAGSGTTLMVARALGRSGIGLDLSMTYIQECAKSRLGFDALEEWTNGKQAADNHADLPLFSTI